MKLKELDFAIDNMAKFAKQTQQITFRICANCSERKLGLFDDESSTEIVKTERIKFTAANGMDPGFLPPELSGLRLVEQTLLHYLACENF